MSNYICAVPSSGTLELQIHRVSLKDVVVLPVYPVVTKCHMDWAHKHVYSSKERENIMVRLCDRLCINHHKSCFDGV